MNDGEYSVYPVNVAIFAYLFEGVLGVPDFLSFTPDVSLDISVIPDVV